MKTAKPWEGVPAVLDAYSDDIKDVDENGNTFLHLSFVYFPKYRPHRVV
jgi:hypothetical protein